MSTRSMRIKVNVSDLIAKIEQVRDSADAEYERLLAKYERDTNKFQVKVYDALARLLDGAGPDDPFVTTTTYIGNRRCTVMALPFNADPPSKPIKPNAKQANQDIALLRLSADDVLSISTDDHFARYLNG
jgi:hypothetical protein